MKRKHLIGLACILALTLSFFCAVTHFIQASTAPVLSVVVSGTTNVTTIPAQSVGSSFSVDVRVDNTAGVTGGNINSISFEVTWDPTVLKCTAATDLTYLPKMQGLGDVAPDNTHGDVTIGEITVDTSNPANGAAPGTVGPCETLTFQVLNVGQSTINLEPSAAGIAYLTYADSSGTSHDIVGTTTVNAVYGSSASPTPSVSPAPTPSPSPSPSPSPTPAPLESLHDPKAIISIQNGTIYDIGSSIVLDGSSSTAGYDTQSCPIQNYAWLVQYENGKIFAAYSGQTVTFTVANPAYLNVTLIVTAPDTSHTPSPNYTNTSYASVWINVEKFPGAQIELFTEGASTPGGAVTVDNDAYGPQELVQMYANVTYNYAPVADKLVTFSVLSPNGTIVAVVTASTNSTGIASQSYRTPWIGDGNFGTWTIVASVDISQVVVTSTLHFTYNYLITTDGITLPASVQRQSSITISVKITSIENSTIWSTATITIYDSQDQPIGSYVAPNTSETAGTSTITESFTIPSWAFVGTATVYVNILTNSPTAGGVAYCPEKVAHFQILT